MSCSNCFNGCAEITSDKCVKYTGADIPALGISYGDTLLHVEEQLAKFIISTLDGTGIVINVPPSVICNLIKKHLPTCPSYQLDELIITIIKAVCDLQDQVDAINSTLDTLNADYIIPINPTTLVPCLSGVVASSDTHAIVQAIIYKLCATSNSLAALIVNVNTNYVKKSEINTFIAAYLATIAPANKAYTKMVPYSPIPYFGALSGYPTPSDSLSTTGQGTGYWEKVYMCNGTNSIPDLRGRTIVGAIVGMAGTASLDAEVNPSNPLNPNYTNGTKAGNNYITLTTNQLPSHNHTATITDPGHKHPIAQFYSRPINYGSENSTPVLQKEPGANSTLVTPTVDNTGTTATTGISASISNTGGGLPHANNQPAMGMYYIVYIP